MGGGSGGGGGAQTNVLRYAPYIEDHHIRFLAAVEVIAKDRYANNPFLNFNSYNQLEANFFGAGFTMNSFGVLFRHHKNLIFDLDVEKLYDDIFRRVVNGQNTKDLVRAESKLLYDEMTEEILPRFMAGARDMNAVMSSTFVIGKANIESARLKMVGKFSAQLRYNLIPQAGEVWKTQLDWNKHSVESYAKLMQFYYMAKMDMDNHNYEMQSKKVLWPFTILNYQQAALAAMQGAKTSTSVAGESENKTAKALGGALSGAAAGAYFGPWGAAAGAVIGGVAGYLM